MKKRNRAASRLLARAAILAAFVLAAALPAGCGRKRNEDASETAVERRASTTKKSGKPIWDEDIPDRGAASSDRAGGKTTSKSDAAPAKKASKSEAGAKALQDGLAAYKKRRYSEAVKCFKQAAEEGDPEAMFKLAICHLDGKGVGINESRGLEYLEKAADAGNAKAEFLLLMHDMDEQYMDDRTIEKKIRKAAPGLLKAAESGDAEAQALCALMCMTVGDIEGAQRWTIEAEENGFDGDF